ncbi:unnamed protein product [Boreogadus saida]
MPVDALRVRLEEKEQVLTKKSKQHQDLSDEKSTLAGEIRDMKDMLEVKERKVSVLQKKNLLYKYEEINTVLQRESCTLETKAEPFIPPCSCAVYNESVAAPVRGDTAALCFNS